MSGFTEKFDTHSSRCYQRIMISFISIYIVLVTVCVNHLSAKPEISVSGPVDSTAFLPCELTSVDTESPHIKWEIKVKTGSKTVFEREGVDSYQAEGYKGRVDVPAEELRKGNCSLVLRNLRLNDTGVYTSYLRVSNTKSGLSVTKEVSRVHLTVHDQREEKPDKNPDSPDKAEERTDKNSDSSDTGGRNHYCLWLPILPGLVFLGLVVWRLKRRKILTSCEFIKD